MAGLTDIAIRKAKAIDKPLRLTDGHGLYLQVTPQGSKLWRMRYEIAGKEKLLSFGAYPGVSLSDARALRDDAKATLKVGRDPAIERKIRRVTATMSPDRTFEGIARAWHAQQAPHWTERHADDVLGSLQRDVFPHIGEAAIADITAATVLGVLREIEARSAPETARRVRQRMSAVFVHAIASSLATNDPAASVGAALVPMKKGKQPSVTELDAARALLATVEAQAGHAVTKLANRLLALTAVRPGELRGARWDEFEGLDGKEPLWIVPPERMKMKREHLVPLARQAVEVIKVLRPLTGRTPLLFPSVRHGHRPMSENAIGYLINRAGFHGQHVPHGWRATFSTAMNELHRADRDVVDLMLAHAPKDKTEAAYNRALHLPRRRDLAQIWADLLLSDAAPAQALTEGPKRRRAIDGNNSGEL